MWPNPLRFKSKPIPNWQLNHTAAHAAQTKKLDPWIQVFLYSAMNSDKIRKPIVSNSIADNWCGFPSRDSITQTSPPASPQKIPAKIVTFASPFLA